MANANYQTSSVYEYVNLLDKEESFDDSKAKLIKSSVEKYMLKARRANSNAKILENLLAD